MWTEILALFLFAAPLLAAPPQRDPDDLSSPIEEMTTQLFQKADENILQAIMNEFAESKKRDQEILEKLNESDQKMTSLNSSFVSGLEEVGDKIDEVEQNNQLRNQNLQQNILLTVFERLEKNLKEEGLNLTDLAFKRPQTQNCKLASQLGLTRLESGVYFLYQGYSRSWKEARNYCLKYGMQLATFETKQEMQLVANATPTSYWGYWVSASDIGQQPGHFLWVDRSKVGVDLWAASNPNYFGPGKETCVYLSIAGQNLLDSSCKGDGNWICELPPKDLPCL